jgi:phosphatidylglycerol:prolipoprotein diacylglycerol transferase
VAFVFGISLSIENTVIRMAARVVAFVPAIVAFVALKPDSFGETVPYQLSTSQWIGLLSALAVSYFFARFWPQAMKSPAFAMSLGDPGALAALNGVSVARPEPTSATPEPTDEPLDAPPTDETDSGSEDSESDSKRS